MGRFTKIRKYVMDDYYSIDLDTLFDWKVAELILKEMTIE
ncbi:hypothetical protein M085_4866 [Bacteroides fragilis str. 3986 N(B)19]|nr:hypothetical protein M085_4866 [Bacteroides fragilis str. 3986 N(B)19]